MDPIFKLARRSVRLVFLVVYCLFMFFCSFSRSILQKLSTSSSPGSWCLNLQSLGLYQHNNDLYVLFWQFDMDLNTFSPFFSLWQIVSFLWQLTVRFLCVFFFAISIIVAFTCTLHLLRLLFTLFVIVVDSHFNISTNPLLSYVLPIVFQMVKTLLKHLKWCSSTFEVY